MGLFSIFKRKPEPTAVAEEPPPPCLHTALIAHWDDPADMGIESKASGWICSACGESFTPGVADVLRRTEADRLKDALGTSEGEP